jgi:hypothetical protein
LITQIQNMQDAGKMIKFNYISNSRKMSEHLQKVTCTMFNVSITNVQSLENVCQKVWESWLHKVGSLYKDAHQPSIHCSIGHYPATQPKTMQIFYHFIFIVYLLYSTLFYFS